MDGVLKEGDKIQVKLLDIDKQGKMKLSRKALLPRPPRPEAAATDNKTV
jgi:polyribonucleotide nucleotidyltransferase